MLSQTVLTTSCVSEEDDLFSSSAAERLMQAEKDYTERLISSEGGWVMELYPTNEVIEPGDDYEQMGMGYVVVAKFNKDNSVKVAMNNSESHDAYMEDSSIWEIISDNGPVLTFNTYNQVLHTFSDPMGYGDIGTGIGGDYEFVVINLEKDAEYAMLKGKKRGTYNRLTRLEPGTDFEQYLQDLKDFKVNTFGVSAPNYIVLDMGDKKYKIEGIVGNICNIYPYDGDAIANSSYWTYLITKHNGKYYLRFRDTFKADNGKEAQEFEFNPSTMQFVDVKDAECKIMGPSADDIASIFERSLYNGAAWSWNRKSTMSDSFKSLVDAVYAGITAYGSNYTMDDSHSIDLAMNADGTKVLLSINYKSGRASTKVQYRYNVAFEGSKMKLTYDTYVNSNANTFYTKIPAVKAIVDAIGTDLEASATVIGGFSLSEVQLKDNSGNLWVNATYVD